MDRVKYDFQFGERQSSPAAKKRSEIAIRCSASLGLSASIEQSISLQDQVFLHCSRWKNVHGWDLVVLLKNLLPKILY